jgi:hypothetical protein
MGKYDERISHLPPDGASYPTGRLPTRIDPIHQQ